MDNYDEIVEEIVKKTGKDRSEIEKMIEEKVVELSNLVSLEGAAYLVAREFGVDVIKEKKERRMKVGDVFPGLSSVNLYGRVLNVSEVKKFEKNGRSGKFADITIGDETGVIRLVLWDKECELLEKNDLKKGDVVLVSECYTKENRGRVELRLGKRGKIKKVNNGENVPEIEDTETLSEKFLRGKRKSIREISEGEICMLKGTVVSFFSRKPFFEVCKECGEKVEREGNRWVCKKHGVVEPAYRAIATFMVDDGTSNIRAVAFGTVAERIYGKDVGEIVEKWKEGEEGFFKGISVLGEEMFFTGRIKINALNDEPEIVVSKVERVDVKREINNLLKKVEKLNGCSDDR